MYTGNINEAIQLDFNGYHQQALEIVDYAGMMFYPGFYVYAVWDAWYYAKTGANKTTSAIPFCYCRLHRGIWSYFCIKTSRSQH